MLILLIWCVAVDGFQVLLYFSGLLVGLIPLVGWALLFFLFLFNACTVIPIAIFVIFLILDYHKLPLNLLSILPTGIIEFIPFINALPIWTGFAVYTITKALWARFTKAAIGAQIGARVLSRAKSVILK